MTKHGTVMRCATDFFAAMIVAGFLFAIWIVFAAMAGLYALMLALTGRHADNHTDNHTDDESHWIDLGQG